jgi:hypothetical protein
MYKDENFIGVKISRVLGCAPDVLPAAERGARSGYDSASNDLVSNSNAASNDRASSNAPRRCRFQASNGRF